MTTIPLGAFHLLEPIASGGMGSVWRAVHPQQGTHVAIKVIAGDAAKEDNYLQSFRNEVRAAASLDHPNVILLLDHGEVSAEAAEASGGKLTEGSPYLAMEHASGGSLAAWRAGLAWPEVKAILLTLLDALAHAHARGVIHRDLKAGNVLLCTEADARPGLKLTDFGIAHASDWQARSGVVEGAAGTLHYMAPEQLLGHWRDYGPWTDLYALGCLAFRLTTGRVPFTGLKGAPLLRAQLYADPPPLQPHHPMPEGFEAWLKTLLVKEHRARYQRAADAAWALAELGDGPSTAQGSGARSVIRDIASPFGPTDAGDDGDAPTLFRPAESIELTTLVGEAGFLPEADSLAHVPDWTSLTGMARPDTSALPMAPPAPPFPKTWRRAVPPPRPMQLVGAGLGLYGLRAIPMIGREPEREALWDALRRVRTTGRAHYVLVRGAAGLGKSRLVQWLTERAHEVGAAEVVRTVLGREEGRDDAVQRLIARTLRTAKLSRPDAVERIEDFLAGRGAVDDDLVLALAELAQAAPSPTSTLSDTGKLRVLRLSSATERHVTARRFLASLGAHRPAIAWFDDVQHSDDSLALAEHLLDERDTHPTPVLVVHTLREEALGEHPALAARIDALLARPGATQVHLDPLDAGATAGLVRGLLGLHDALAVQVEERSAGNPAFAVQLVGDWVARRVLEVGREGFVLRAGEAAQLPDDIFAVWQARIDQLLEGLPEEARTHLERAAILGLSVNEEEWQEACDDPEGAKKQWVGGSRVALTMTGLRTRATLSERLAEAHLVEETDVGWSFLHGMLRETLERGAREAGRWADHHRACASMLRRLELDDASERLGRHLLEAGDLVGALPSLMAGAREAWTLRGVRPALGVLAQAEEVMGWLGLPDSDPVRGEALRLRCQMMQFQGETSEAERLARVAVEAAREHAWTRLLPEALFELGVVLLQQRRFEEAEPLLLQANDLAGSISNLPLLGRTFLELGRLSRRRGDYKEAARLVQGARRCFQTTGDRVALANALETLGDVARDAGKKKSAWDLYTSAAKLAEECGSREVLAGAVLSRGEMLRQAGELDHARKEYQRALALYEAVGAWRAVLCRINLGLLYLEAGRARAARQIVDEGLPALGPTKRPHLLAAAHLILAACAGSSREWALWDRHWAAADELLQATRFTDADLARIAAIAAEQAAQAEEKPRAVIAAALATAQYRAVGREAEAASISEAARAWLPS